MSRIRLHYEANLDNALDWCKENIGGLTHELWKIIIREKEVNTDDGEVFNRFEYYEFEFVNDSNAIQFKLMGF